MTKSVRRALLSAMLAVGFLAPAAEAQAAQCTWQRTELPVPSPYRDASVSGVAGDYIAGIANSMAGSKLALWHKGQATLLSWPASTDNAGFRIVDVNRSGTVLVQRSTIGNGNEAYVVKADGTSKVLGHPTGQDPNVYGMNDSGDVVGYLWANGSTTNVVWPAWDYTRYRVLKPAASPIGIDNAGTVVFSNGEVQGPPGFTWKVQVPAGVTEVMVRAFENNRILGEYWQNNQWHGVVWRVNGSVDYDLDLGQAMTFSVNRLGTVVGAGPSFEIRLWRNGVVDPNVPAPSPSVGPGRVFVDNNDVIYSAYYDGDSQFAGQWRCS
ncbi:hypothetical protein [Actinocrispum sp. NPDC049592]|uniref:hypothetical protein n=1 Tax=Actinocrispum sp. NPDC049592 TaxID=3154835 RepID=UPI003449A73A